jgi:nucleoside-diphosphate-sugar epimerase
VNLALAGGHDVVAVDTLWFDKAVPLVHWSNPKYTFRKTSFSNTAFLEEFLPQVDYVVHLAAVVGEPASKLDQALTFKTNVTDTESLLAAAAKHKVKGVLFMSTCSNYGIAEGMATEDSPLRPLSPYAESKVKIEEQLAGGKYPLNWIVCRMSTVFGVAPRMRFDLTVNDFTLNAHKDKKLEIFLPHTFRPYIHVFDAARALLALLQDFSRTKNQVFNVGFPGENYEKRRIADLCKKHIPGLDLKIVESGMDTRDYQVDFSKIDSFLKLEQTHTVESGVKEILASLAIGAFGEGTAPKFSNTTPALDA